MVSYTYDAADQLLELSGAVEVSYRYDGNGNLVDDGTSSYVYDPRNRMGSSTRGGATTSYAYSGDGRRIRSVAGNQTTTWGWDTTWPNAQLTTLSTDSPAART